MVDEMLKNSMKKKLVVMLLIFTMTFGNFAFVGKTYADSIWDVFFEDEGDTGSANVEFDVYFSLAVDESSDELEEEEADESLEEETGSLDEELDDEDYTDENDTDEDETKADDTESDEDETESTEETSITEEDAEVYEEDTESEEEAESEETTENIGTNVKADVNTDLLRVTLTLKVSNSGYLKDARIILGNGEELNFEVDSTNIEGNESVQSYEENSIELSQINADSEIEITFPISYSGGTYVDLETISKDNVISFEGTYVDGEDEISVSKEVTLSLTWQDEREVSVTSEVTKYISYESDGETGVILQIAVQTSNETEGNALPVQSSTLEIEVPTINGTSPSSLSVAANSLEATTGKGVGEVSFGSDNLSYDEEEGILTITVENETELVSIQDEEEVLIDETVEEVEAYEVGNGTDEYLITYIYDNVTLENVEIGASITSTLIMCGGTVLTATEDETYELGEEIGDIVTFSSTTETTSISKGYTYLNYNNEESMYEIEIDNKLVFNISYKDIVSSLQYEDGTNYYVTEAGEAYEQDDIYYKSITIGKDNFDEMLGESGYVNIYDASGNLLVTINSETEVAESGDYEINFDSTIKWIRIETSSPITEGNLVFSCIKAYTSTSYDKDTYKNFSKISINSVGKAGYTYLTDLVDCGTGVAEILLDDTTTEATIVLGQESLSTLAMNNNVEIKIELNNDEISSDVYGESEFIIEMPEYIETIEVTDYSIVYGEGLELSSIEAYEENGTIYLKINVTGSQQYLSSGIVSNGTNIVLDANIKVDLYTPSTTGTFKLVYTNSEATNYAVEQDGKGYSEAEIKYSAPSGVVAVNSISNYNSAGETVASVNQGTQVGELDIYSESRTATMDLIIMNNEENTISNIVILGRTVFEGNTDLLTGEDLGTTLDGVMISGIVSDESNGTDFTIYYSTNGEATEDLTDITNGWTTEIDDLSTVKSYLIVPNDSSYELEVAEKLHFSYEFEIPENLSHNEYLYGTFGIYYTNNTDVATLDETSVADLVGVSTGVGPELEVDFSLNKTSVSEYEEFEATVTVTNVGEVTGTNVQIEIPVPDYVTYSRTETEYESLDASDYGSYILYVIDEMEAGEEIEITTVYEVGTISESDYQIELYATVTADDLGVVLQTETKSLTVNEAEIKVELVSLSETENRIYKKGESFLICAHVCNLTDDDLDNVVISLYLDEMFEFDYISMYDKDNNYSLTEIGEFDSETRLYTYTLDTLSKNEALSLYICLTIDDLKGTELLDTAELTLTAKADGTDSYTSVAYTVTAGKASLSIKQTTTTTNTYVQEGDTIEYVFTITNEGTVDADNIVLTDTIPDGVSAKTVSYSVSGTTYNRTVSGTDDLVINLNVGAGETQTVTVTAVAETQSGIQELSITNVGTLASVEDSDDTVLTSNEITHIIESDGSTTVGESSTGTTSSSTSSSIVKSYNITGVAWLDSNEDGARDDTEELIKGITVTLVNSDTGVIKQTDTTDSSGAYKFTGVETGNYIVLFDYDTVAYTVTTYQKENVASNINSDVISTKIEQDGSYRNGAVSSVVTISDGSISNIDIGLVEAMKFDLNLEVGITKITVQNSKGTTTDTYDAGTTLTKTEISQRYISGSEVYIEYTFTVTNEGDVSGYAVQFVDYLPDGMTFNSSLNSNWYTGTDGNLYTTVLGNTEIAPGESKTFTLVLTKTMTSESTGRISNTAEIAADYNIYGISDYDSTPGNNDQNEDDFGRADAILGVGTGGTTVIISTIVVIALVVGTTAVILMKKKRSKADRKGGV